MTVANIRITQIKLKRGNTTVSNTYTGPRSELTHDTGPVGTGPHTVRIHDGITPGGTIIASQGWVNEALANVGNVDLTSYATITYVDDAIANVVLGNVDLTGYATITYVDDAIANVDTGRDGANVAVSNTAPTVIQGNLWYNTVDGRAYLYADGIWRDFSPQVVPANMVSYDTLTGDIILNDDAEITYANGVSILSGLGGGGGSTYGNTDVAAYLPVYGGNIKSSVIGNGFGLTISQIQLPENNGPLNIINNAGNVNIISNPSTLQAWNFGSDGSLTLPSSGILADTFGDGGVTLQSPQNKYAELGTFDGNAYVWVADAGYEGVGTESAAYVVTRYNTPQENRWTFGADGITSLPGYSLPASDGTLGQVLVTNGSGTVSWSNQSIGGTNYSDSNVAAYLSNFDGVITFTASPATITGLGNITSANFTFQNGLSILYNITISTTYGDSNVATYLSNHNIAAQIQADYTQSDTGNVSYIKNKPDLSVYATTTQFNTLNANIGSYYIWANANVGGLYNSITGANITIQNLSANVGGFYTYANATYSTVANAASLQSQITGANADIVTANTAMKSYVDAANTTQSNQISTFQANVGSYYIWANANVGSLQNQITGANATISTFQANVGSFYTWANTNFGTSSYANSNVAAYLTSQGIAAQLQSDWNQASTGNVTYIKNKPTNVSSFTNDAGYLTNVTVATSTTTIQTANVAIYNSVTANTTNATFYPGFFSATAGNLATYTNSGLQFNPSTGNLSVPGSLVATQDIWTATGNIRTSGGTGNVFNFSATTVNMGGAATAINMGAAGGNVNIVGNVVTTGATSNLWVAGGAVRTSAATAYVFNNTPTTVYMAGGATIGTYIGNASGVTQLYGNVQGSTNGFAIGYRDIPQVTFNANATTALSDAGKHYYSTSSSALTLTVANNATVAFSTGAAINIVNQGTGTITIAPAGGVTIYLAGNSTSGSRTLASYGVATVQKVATDTWFLVGVGLT